MQDCGAAVLPATPAAALGCSMQTILMLYASTAAAATRQDCCAAEHTILTVRVEVAAAAHKPAALSRGCCKPQLMQSTLC